MRARRALMDHGDEWTQRRKVGILDFVDEQREKLPVPMCCLAQFPQRFGHGRFKMRCVDGRSVQGNRTHVVRKLVTW